MKWDTLKIDDQFYWSWIFIVSDFISRIFHQYWCQNWRPIPLVVDFHSIRFHFTNFFIDFQKTNENLFSWLLLVKMNIMELGHHKWPLKAIVEGFLVLFLCRWLLYPFYGFGPLSPGLQLRMPLHRQNSCYISTRIWMRNQWCFAFVWWWILP